MGGWDNHPEYGGPGPTWWGTAIIVTVILAIAALVFLALRWKHPLRLSWEQQQYISTQRSGQGGRDEAGSIRVEPVRARLLRNRLFLIGAHLFDQLLWHHSFGDELVQHPIKKDDCVQEPVQWHYDLSKRLYL